VEALVAFVMMMPKFASLFIVLLALTTACSSSSRPKTAVTGSNAQPPQSSRNTGSETKTSIEEPLVGKWTGQVMIDKLPAILTLTFQKDGKLIFDLGATERSRPDYKIEEYFVDDPTHVRTVYTPDGGPREEYRFDYKIEGDTLTLKWYQENIVLTRKKTDQ
jgi:hypothetical protein